MILHYIIIFTILVLISFVYLKYARIKKILDNPKARSSHTIPTIRGGGVIFFASVLLFFIFQLNIEYPYFFIGFLILSIMGFIDDRKELSAKIRFPFQLIAVGLILYNAGLFSLEIPIYVQIVGFVIGVGFINAFNFMDGINGITGIYTVAIIIPLLYLNNQFTVFNNDFFYSVLISILVFAFYNFRKNALMFAGDIGSMALASTLLFWISKMMIVTNNPLLLLFVFFYGLDSALTIIYRIFLKEDISEAHRHHIYQKLVDQSKLSHLKVAFLFATLQIAFSFIVIKSIDLSFNNQIIFVFIYILVGSVFYVLLQRWYKKKNNSKV